MTNFRKWWTKPATQERRCRLSGGNVARRPVHEQKNFAVSHTAASKDFLAEAGEDELDAEKRCAVVLVEDGIDLDDFEGNHGLGVGDHFHGEMGFPVGDAATDGSANTGGIGGGEEIPIPTHRRNGEGEPSAIAGERPDAADTLRLNVARC